MAHADGFAEDAGRRSGQLRSLMEINQLTQCPGDPPEFKPSNPKDAMGIKKPPLSYISMPVLFEVGLGMLEGGHKYGRHNYRTIGVRASIYFDATMRHLAAWWEGEDYDPDSKAKLHHLSKAIASLTVMRDAIINDMWEDDRPPIPKHGWMEEFAREVGVLNQQYPEPKASHTQKKKNG